MFSQVKSECGVQSSDNSGKNKSSEADFCDEFLSELKLD